MCLEPQQREADHCILHDNRNLWKVFVTDGAFVPAYFPLWANSQDSTEIVNRRHRGLPPTDTEEKEKNGYDTNLIQRHANKTGGDLGLGSNAGQ